MTHQCEANIKYYSDYVDTARPAVVTYNTDTDRFTVKKFHAESRDAEGVFKVIGNQAYLMEAWGEHPRKIKLCRMGENDEPETLMEMDRPADNLFLVDFYYF